MSRDGEHYHNQYDILPYIQDLKAKTVSYVVPAEGPLREEELALQVTRPYARNKEAVVTSILKCRLVDKNGTDQTHAYRVFMK